MVKKNWSNPEVVDLGLKETKEEKYEICNIFDCPLKLIERKGCYYFSLIHGCTYIKNEGIPDVKPSPIS